MSYRQSPLRPRGGGRRRPSTGLIVVLVLLLVAVAAGGLYLYPRLGKHGHGTAGPGSAGASGTASPAGAAVAAFAAAWTKGDLSTVSYAAGLTGTDVQTEYAAITKSLQARSVQVTALGAQPSANDRVSNSVLTVSWLLPGDQVWKYQSAVDVDEVDGTWLVAWKPSIVQPTLGTGDSLKYTRLAAKRATVLDGAGQPLIVDRAVTDIGVEAGRAGDPTATATQLSSILSPLAVVSAPGLAGRIRGAPANQFVDVITLRQPDFESVAAQLSAVPGIVTRDLTLPLSPSHDFARSFLGTVGPVTKEIVDASKGRYVAGDVAGLGGLEKDFDAMIGGTPGFEIDVVHPSSEASPPPPTAVQLQAAVDGVSLQTTLDQRVEAAADAAVGSITNQPSALVAVRVSTGQVIAVANGPSGGGFDSALLGAVPPGSAFKIVTTMALLERGQDVNAPVVCSPQIVVQGKTFHNFEGEQLGSVPFHTDFAKSCNTAFASLSSKVGGTTLFDTARAMGIGACWSLGTSAFRGKVVPPKDLVDLAATSFGQGSTLVSPVSLAVAVGSVARGSYVAPQLVLNGAPQDCATAGASASASGSGSGSASALASASVASAPPASASAAGTATASTAPIAAPVPLPAAAVTRLRALMREVVTVGTGVVLVKAPGTPVMAKTGTAEYGPGSPPKTHAWLIGYQGDIAFAVYVQDGQSGGAVAAPVALKFLQNLAKKP
jgi:cell division protein FtsI/penicillin-binding protein 2